MGVLPLRIASLWTTVSRDLVQLDCTKVGSTMIDIDHIRLQFARLVRHRESAKSGDDPVAFLDLAHSLRIWVDMKSEVDQILTSMNARPRFKHTSHDRRYKEMLRGSGYVFVHLPIGARTAEGKLQGLIWTDKVLPDADAEKIGRMGPPTAGSTDLTFSQWLGSEIIETTETTSGSRLAISREMLIERVASFLGASHPAGMGSSTELENRFDPHVRRLHEIRVLGGIRLTYYQLVEVAEHMIEALSPFFGDTGATSAG